MDEATLIRLFSEPQFLFPEDSMINSKGQICGLPMNIKFARPKYYGL